MHIFVKSKDKLRIQLSSGVSLETLRRYLKGGKIRDISRERIERAAKRLGISLEAP
jgi:predicted site-specific integrase-resolvase